MILGSLQVAEEEAAESVQVVGLEGSCEAVVEGQASNHVIVVATAAVSDLVMCNLGPEGHGGPHKIWSGTAIVNYFVSGEW